MAAINDPYQYKPFASPFAPPAVSEAERQQIVAQRPTSTPTDFANSAIDFANWLATRQVRPDIAAPAAPFTRIEKPAATPVATPVQSTQPAISETPVATSLAAQQQQQPAARGAVPPGFVTEMRGLQTSYYNPETQVRAPTTAAAEVLSRPAPKTFDEYLQRVAATAEDPKSALAAISQMEANRVRQNAVQAAQIRARETQINDMRAALKEPMLDKETRARYIQQLPIMEAQLLFSQGLLTEDALNSLFSKPATAQKKANGGLVGFANGGEVDMQDTPDMPMAIDPTAAGKSAGMESGDYVFPVEAVQFYGLKMLKDMVKKAMMAD